MDPINLRRYLGGAASASARQPIRWGPAEVGLVELPDEKFEAQLRLLLGSGGDERIWPNPQTGRNKYGVPTAPALDEIWLSSSTASAITPLAYGTAARVLRQLIESNFRDRLKVEDWFEQIRSRLLRLFGIPGVAAILTASGTEAELIALAVARSLFARPLMNIVIAPGETGSGVMVAAGGQHFLSSTTLAGSVSLGSRINGWEAAQIDVETVEIRGPAGAARSAADIDREVGRKVAEALKKGMDVLLHVLDTSKTGLSGLSRTAA
jgi:hypothetical protein